MKKVLFENKWMNVIELDGWYVCTDEVRTNDNDFVCVLPWGYRDGTVKFLLRMEHNPAHGDKVGEMGLSCITGQCESGNILYHAKQELKEEGGYKIDSQRFNSLGSCMPLKSSMAKIHLFEVHVRDHDKQQEALGDGTTGEEGAYPIWVNRKRVEECKDPYIQTILVRSKL